MLFAASFRRLKKLRTWLRAWATALPREALLMWKAKESSPLTSSTPRHHLSTHNVSSAWIQYIHSSVWICICYVYLPGYMVLWYYVFLSLNFSSACLHGIPFGWFGFLQQPKAMQIPVSQFPIGVNVNSCSSLYCPAQGISHSAGIGSSDGYRWCTNWFIFWFPLPKKL